MMDFNVYGNGSNIPFQTSGGSRHPEYLFSLLLSIFSLQVISDTSGTIK